MAALDEEWLYGDSDAKKEKDVEGTEHGTDAPSALSASAEPFQPKDEPSANGDSGDPSKEVLNGEGEKAGEKSGGGEGAAIEDNEGDDEDDDDDDDSDDDVQITIGDIKTQSATYDKFKTGYQRPVGAPATAVKQPTKGVDLDAVGTINGVPVFEFDIGSLEDKPWRKPGADITDYFNYGFNEDTWQQYCEKQRRLRIENNAGLKIFAPNVSDDFKRQNRQNKPQLRGQTANQGIRPSYAGQKKFTSPVKSQPTTINVIGAHNTRRPATQEFESQSFDASQTPPPPGVGGVGGASPAAPPSSSFTVPVHMPPPSTSNISLTSHPMTSSYAPHSATTSLPPTSYAPPVSMHPPGVAPPQQVIGVVAAPVHSVQVVAAVPPAMPVQPAPPGVVPAGPPPPIMLPPTHQRPPPMGPPRGPPPGMGGPPPGPGAPPPGYGGPRPMPGMAPRGPPPGFQGPPGAVPNQGMAPRGPPGFQAPPNLRPNQPPSQGFPPYGPPPGGTTAPPPHRGPPPPFQGERPPYSGAPSNSGPPPPRYNAPPAWEKETDARNWMDLPMSDDDLSDDEGRGSRRKTDRHRDSSGRRRERSRSRERDRRDRDRDRDRRDDRHRSSRRK